MEDSEMIKTQGKRHPNYAQALNAGGDAISYVVGYARVVLTSQEGLKGAFQKMKCVREMEKAGVSSTTMRLIQWAKEALHKLDLIESSPT
jgi:hypothetical protein